MMFRRSRSVPRKLLYFRLFAFSVGLFFVLGTTNTIETVRSTVAALSRAGEAIRNISGTDPTPKKQEDHHG